MTETNGKENTMRGRVFVLQDDPRKDLSEAEEYGDLVFMLPTSVQLVEKTEPTVDALFRALWDYNPNRDYLLLMGDPASIGLATSVATLRGSGRFQMLKWDRRTRSYLAMKANTVKGAVKHAKAVEEERVSASEPAAERGDD